MEQEVKKTKIWLYVKEKWQHVGFQRYLKNTSWLTMGQFFSLAMSFVVGILIMRYLGPGNYGTLSYSLSFAGLFSVIAGIGIDGILQRELIKNPENENALLGTSCIIKFFTGLLAWLIATVAIYVTSNDFTHIIIVSLFSLTFIIQSFNVIDSLFRSEVKARYGVIAQMVATLISALFKVAVVFFHLGFLWIVVAYVADVLIFNLALVVFLGFKNKKVQNWKFDGRLAINMTRDSWPLALSATSALILMKIDQVMIGQMMNSVQVGIYAAAARLTEIWYFIPTVIGVSLFPAIVNAKKISAVIYFERLKKMYLVIFLLAIGVAIFMTAFSGLIIKILLGNDYIGSGKILGVYIWSNVGMFCMYVLNYQLIAEHKSKLLFLINLIAAVLNVLLNLWLIPALGVIGAAYATLISCLLYTSDAADE